MHFRLPERTIGRVTGENEDDVWIKAAASSIGWKACGWHIASTVFHCCLEGSRRRIVHPSPDPCSWQDELRRWLDQFQSQDFYKSIQELRLIIPIRLLMVGHCWIMSVEPRAMHKGGCFEWGHWIPAMSIGSRRCRSTQKTR